MAAVIAAGNRSADLSRIKAPTLVIHGTADRLAAPSGASIPVVLCVSVKAAHARASCRADGGPVVGACCGPRRRDTPGPSSPAPMVAKRRLVVGAIADNAARAADAREALGLDADVEDDAALVADSVVRRR